MKDNEEALREIEELEKNLRDAIEQLRQNLAANIGALQVLEELKGKLIGEDSGGNE